MKILPLVLAGFILGGCAAEGGVLSEVQEAAADLFLPPEQAAQLGARMAQEIEAKQPLHPSAQLQSRVARFGQQVLAQAGEVPQAYDFSFKAIEDPDTVNAFALPGGQIYVTSGLVELAGTDAQLASVLAHEVAHVTERHIAERLATSYGVQALGAAALGADAGTVSQLVGSVLQQGFLLKYSRDQELQADRVGVRYLRQAGYDPNAAIAMFRKLQQASGDGPPVFLSSHPSTGDRIEQLREVIARSS